MLKTPFGQLSTYHNTLHGDLFMKLSPVPRNLCCQSTQGTRSGTVRKYRCPDWFPIQVTGLDPDYNTVTVRVEYRKGPIFIPSQPIIIAAQRYVISWDIRFNYGGSCFCILFVWSLSILISYNLRIFIQKLSRTLISFFTLPSHPLPRLVIDDKACRARMNYCTTMFNVTVTT